MSDLAALPEKLLMERILHGNSAWAERSRLELALIAVSGSLIFLGAAFLIFAMHLWFQSNYPPEVAAAFTGFTLLAVALITLLVSLRIVRWRRDRLKELKQEVHDTLQSTFDFLEDELAEPVQNNPITAVVLASLAGYVAGEKYL